MKKQKLTAIDMDSLIGEIDDTIKKDLENMARFLILNNCKDNPRPDVFSMDFSEGFVRAYIASACNAAGGVIEKYFED
jgi:hypothetical protein